MMGHNPQQNYPKQNAPGMFDARPAVNASTPQSDSYGNGMPTNSWNDGAYGSSSTEYGKCCERILCIQST